MRLTFLDHNLRPLTALALFCTVFCFLSPHANAQYRFDISHMNAVTHIEIPEISQTDYQIQKKAGTVEIQITSLDPKSVDYLERYSDLFVKKITVSRNASLSRDIVTIQLHDPKLEMFDYLTDAPSSLSVDFYVDDGPVAGANSEDSDETKTSEKKLFGKQRDKANPSRSIASSEFIKEIQGISLLSELDEIKKEQDGPVGKKKNKKKDTISVISTVDAIKAFDPETVNFTFNSIIENRGKIFLSFPILFNEDEYLAQLLTQKIQYEIEPGTDIETKDFMKLKRLFAKADHRNFLKAKKIFVKKYSDSKYAEMSGYMEAEALFALYKADGSEVIFTQALKMYDALLAKYPDSNLNERTMLLVSYLRMKKGKYMDAVRNLKTYTERYKASPLLPNIELIMAQGLLRMRDYEESLKIYQKVVNSESPEAREKATFDLGDAFFEKKEYAKAIKYYTQAVATYPKVADKYPNVHFNLGEAQFLSEKYKESLVSYKKFIDHFPQHEYAAYAWTRMGEILEAADVESNLWRGYYNESVFRFQNSNGGIVAKINLLAQQAKKTDGNKFDMVIEEMRFFAGKLTLPHAAEYLTVKIADAFSDKGHYKKATDEMIAFFQSEKIPTYEDKFLRRIGRGISFQIRDALQKNKVEAAFSIFDSYDSLWQRKSQRIDFDYLRGVGFEKAQLYKKAIPSYSKFLTNYGKLPEPNETLVFEQLPSLDEINLRLANCQVRDGQFKSAEAQMARSKVEALSEPSKDEWYYLSSRIAENKNDIGSAVDLAESINMLNLESVQWLAALYTKNKMEPKALAALDKFVEGKKLSSENRFLLLKLKLAVLEKTNTPKYYDFLKRFHAEFKGLKFDYDREKFRLGVHLASLSKMNEAEDVWAGISKKSIWEKMAQETRDEKQWDGQYKKYINRIPAMASPQEKAP